MADDSHPDDSDPVVNLHLPSLLTQIRVLAGAMPDARMVGLVADSGTQEADFLKWRGPVDTAPDGSVSALITREVAREILFDTNPRLVEWLFEDRFGPHRMLPIVHSARRAARTMAVSYDL